MFAKACRALHNASKHSFAAQPLMSAPGTEGSVAGHCCLTGPLQVQGAQVPVLPSDVKHQGAVVVPVSYLKGKQSYIGTPS